MLPVRSSTLAVRSALMPNRLAAASMMRMLAWCGTSSATSSMDTPAWLRHASADSTMARTARRNSSRPSISM